MADKVQHRGHESDHQLVRGVAAGGFGVISHVGRKSGKVYRTSINVFRVPNGFIIALTYSGQLEWVKNLLAGSVNVSYLRDYQCSSVASDDGTGPNATMMFQPLVRLSTPGTQQIIKTHLPILIVLFKMNVGSPFWMRSSEIGERQIVGCYQPNRTRSQ